jgi:hypothetical protein
MAQMHIGLCDGVLVLNSEKFRHLGKTSQAVANPTILEFTYDFVQLQRCNRLERFSRQKKIVLFLKRTRLERFSRQKGNSFVSKTH